MAGSVNKVILVGNLGRDPEVRRLGSGDPVVNLRIATSESWKDKQSGERKEKTEWHSVVIFNENLARVAEQYLKKGSKVYIEGQLQTRKWQDQSGSGKIYHRDRPAAFPGRIDPPRQPWWRGRRLCRGPGRRSDQPWRRFRQLVADGKPASRARIGRRIEIRRYRRRHPVLGQSIAVRWFFRTLPSLM